MRNKRPILTIENISHNFHDENHASLRGLLNVNLQVPTGSITAFVGPSGCGKSTLLRIIAGLIKPTHGEVKRHFETEAMVFQHFAIFPWLTVHENVEFGLKMRGLKRRDRAHIAEEKLKEVGLIGLGNQMPRELSGGQRQRVSIARALAVRPEILLMDEPFSSLDTITGDHLREDILRLWKKYQMTVIIVTHLIEEAVLLADEVLVFSARPGHVKASVTIDLPRPRERRSDGFYRLVDRITRQIEQ